MADNMGNEMKERRAGWSARVAVYLEAAETAGAACR